MRIPTNLSFLKELKGNAIQSYPTVKQLIFSFKENLTALKRDLPPKKFLFENLI